ncbi:hypothetical protein RIdsm_02546 [Roseovarius indicus]|uniref:Uncharacterized protein n=2 Tax=Roseovarius indicus TaxID=540747 RepID=A0A5P3AD99_9RHOB|nr:hypothetical protein RIdsm_02546 [Roseovarius indicus]SFD60758.1 hypothetical protein SAMN04488031_101797 [Roseovarius indicus]
MVDRTVPTSASPGTYEDMLDKYAALWALALAAAVLPLTNVGGTANAVTADVDPEIPAAGFSAGMVFSITWGATNTSSGVTIAIGSESAVDIVDADGTTLEVGQIEDGRTDVLIYDGTDFRLLTGGAEIDNGSASITTYTTSDTWVNSAAENTIVMVELWGGGADGTTTNGGDGGEYNRAFFKAGDLTSTVAIGVGAGGGNDSTFGSYLTARGGQGEAPAGAWLGGAGGANGEGGTDAMWGGGGGSGSGGPGGGSSEYGGAGGSAGNDGAAPAGGGGANGSGARGEARITVF